MRPTICSCALLLGALAAFPTASALAAGGDAAARRLASVRVVECSRGPDAIDRHATFRGAMRRLPGTHGMSMRFSLQERVGDGRYRTVKAPGLGVWRKSHPAVRRFSHRQRVLDLAEGAAYRAVVSFRWYDTDGELIRRAKRRSRACNQPGLLPNLGVLWIGAGVPLPGAPSSATYAVRVINRGHAAAPRFGVSFAVDGTTVDTQSVGELAPGEVRQLFFVGPPCRSSLTARVDTADDVRETSERDNPATVACA